MTNQAQTPPPGWYPTPDGSLRYWDGRRWTDQRAAPPLRQPHSPRARMSGAVKWLLVILGLVLVVGGGTCVALLVGVGDSCDVEAVQGFESLPSYPGVTVELATSAGIGCTDTVDAPDPDAFIEHYAKVMGDAGWTVQYDEPPRGGGVLGVGPSSAVRLDRLEGTNVGVYVSPPEDLTSE